MKLVEVLAPGIQVKVAAPPAVKVAGVAEQTRVDDATAVTGNGATLIVVTVEVVPQPLVPEIV